MRHPESKAEWKRITKSLEESRGDARMTPIDREQIAAMCELWAGYAIDIIQAEHIREAAYLDGEDNGKLLIQCGCDREETFHIDEPSDCEFVAEQLRREGWATDGHNFYCPVCRD